jgi:hypothetical protein
MTKYDGLGEICFGFQLYDNYRRLTGVGHTNFRSKIDRKMYIYTRDMCGATNVTTARYQSFEDTSHKFSINYI